MAYQIYVQNDSAHAAHIHQVHVSIAIRHRRLCNAHARAVEAYSVVKQVSVSLVNLFPSLTISSVKRRIGGQANQRCSSWFKNGNIHGPVIAIWPGSRLHWFEALKEPRYEDMIIEYLGNNRFEYLGNGYTATELDPEGNAVWYFDALGKELKMGTGVFDVLV
jgi:hypothetical protein